METITYNWIPTSVGMEIVNLISVNMISVDNSVCRDYTDFIIHGRSGI
jgi:hypothetical protein